MDLEIVQHDDHSLPLALALQPDEEVLEVGSGVALAYHMVMDEASLIADGAYYGDGGSPAIHQLQFHTRPDPGLAHLLPQMEGGLIDVDDLVVALLSYHGPQATREVQLLLLQISLLSEGLPVLVVCSFEADPLSVVVIPKSIGTELLKSELLSNDRDPLSETEMSHALEGLWGHQPLHLFWAQRLLAPFSLLVDDCEIIPSPPVDDLQLAARLDPGAPEDLCISQPSMVVRVEGAMAKEDDKRLHLNSVSLSNLKAEGLSESQAMIVL